MQMRNATRSLARSVSLTTQSPTANAHTRTPLNSIGPAHPQHTQFTHSHTRLPRCSFRPTQASSDPLASPPPPHCERAPHPPFRLLIILPTSHSSTSSSPSFRPAPFDAQQRHSLGLHRTGLRDDSPPHCLRSSSPSRFASHLHTSRFFIRSVSPLLLTARQPFLLPSDQHLSSLIRNTSSCFEHLPAGSHCDHLAPQFALLLTSSRPTLSSVATSSAILQHFPQHCHTLMCTASIAHTRLSTTSVA